MNNLLYKLHKMHFKGVKAKTISYFKPNQSKGKKILQ